MMSYKKLLSLSQGVCTLHKTSRAHHEMVVKLERAMSDTISENDLRRAIGLALEEFDSQLVEAFRDSNRKCMSMFAKTEDVVEMQGKMDKKVNFAEYNFILQKLTDLRRYIDTMAESVLVGHQESNEAFAKSEDVDRDLNLKADITELTQIRAKLERLEAIVSANDLKHNGTMEDLKEQVTNANANNIKANRTMIEENQKLIGTLKTDGVAMDKRMVTAEGQIGKLTQDTRIVMCKQEEMQQRQDGTIWRACQSLQGLFHTMEGKMSTLGDGLQQLRSNEEQFKAFSTQRFQQLFDADEQVKEQVKFLVEASEMLKRRTREFQKKQDIQVKDLTSSEDKLTQQMAAIERSFKGQERELKTIEKRIPQVLSLLASDPSPPPDTGPVDSNQHLNGVLAQLERISDGTATRLPRPLGNDMRVMADQDTNLMSALANLAGMAPLPLGAGGSAAKPQPAGYAQSPRLPMPGLKLAPPAGPAGASGPLGSARKEAAKKGLRS